MVYCIPCLPVYPLLLIQSNQLDTTVFCPAGSRFIGLNRAFLTVTMRTQHVDIDTF